MNDNVILFPGKPAPEQIEAAKAHHPASTTQPAGGELDIAFVQNSCLVLMPVLDELLVACQLLDRERANEIIGAVRRQVLSWPDTV
jgi:hypothetical protein